MGCVPIQNELYVLCKGLFAYCYNVTIALQVLSDPIQRMVYDEIHGYALTAMNPFMDDSAPRDHVFVDEFSCIGMSFSYISRFLLMI